MTIDTEVRDRLAPLSTVEPTPAEIHALREAQRAEVHALRAAQRTEPATRGPRRRRPALRLGGVLAIAAATAAALVVAPGGPGGTAGGPLVSPLETAAAAAAERPGPADFSGYRYLSVIETIHAPWLAMTPGGGAARYVQRQRREQWVDARWRGRERVHDARVIEATPRDPARPEDRELARRVLRDDRIEPVRVSAFRYGDGPFARVPLPELPAEPAALLSELRAAEQDGRWAARPEAYRRIDWDRATREFWLGDVIVNLLVEANATPRLRAAAFGAFARIDGVTVSDASTGKAAELRIGDGRIRLVFDPRTSDVLGWTVENRPEESGVRREYVIEDTSHVERPPADVR